MTRVEFLLVALSIPAVVLVLLALIYFVAYRLTTGRPPSQKADQL